MIYILWLIAINVFEVNSVAVKNVSSIEKTNEYWIRNGRKQLNSKLNEKPITSTAKNVILVIGDGMGISTLTSARIYKNQRQIQSNLPDENLIFENFPNVGLSKTYSVDKYVADSAATATAILTGIKTNNGILGLAASVQFRNCSSYTSKSQELLRISEMLYNKGKSIGFVTTTSILDATPASMYASTPARSWQHEYYFASNYKFEFILIRVPKNCTVKDIARQFLKKSEIFQVVLGGGRSSFIPKNEFDPEYPNMPGRRKDGRNLLTEWSRKMTGKWKDKAKFVYNSSEFNGIDTEKIKYLFGLFEPGNMKYEDERTDDPTLEQMTVKAINILSKNPKGYFLLIEGGKVDKAHHENTAVRAILETLELEKAVIAADKMSSEKDTLIIITADHSHTFTLGSYLNRNADILGKNEGYVGQVLDKKGFTSLLYGTGPGHKMPRENITSSKNFTGETLYHSGVPLPRGTHGGEEVSVYARGPWGHMLKDIYEQSYIGHVIMYASCVGLYDDRIGCNLSTITTYHPMINILLLVLFFFIFYF